MRRLLLPCLSIAVVASLSFAVGPPAAARARVTPSATRGATPGAGSTTGVTPTWQVSAAFGAGTMDLSTVEYPGFYSIFLAGWEDVPCEASGLIDLTRHREKSPEDTACVLARTVFSSPKRQRVRLSFGYNDEAALFLNGRKVFHGSISSAPGQLCNDAYLTVEKGLNEILFFVKSHSGQWGFAHRTDCDLQPPARARERLVKAWETPQVFLTPESVLYDRKRDVLYVTSFDNKYRQDAAEDEYTGYISRVRLNGEVENLKWVTGLHAPCGMALRGNSLFTVERRNLAEIDASSGKILNRYPIPGCVFPNDLVVAPDGAIYITDTSPAGAETSRIYRFEDGTVEVWLETDGIGRPNGIYVRGDSLLVGSTGDGFLKAINVKDKRISPVACLGAGVVDGVKLDGEGGFLVSHWEGQVYSVSASGDITELMDAIGRFNTADFEYVPDRRLLLIPTFLDNRVVAYRISD